MVGRGARLATTVNQYLSMHFKSHTPLLATLQTHLHNLFTASVPPTAPPVGPRSLSRPRHLPVARLETLELRRPQLCIQPLPLEQLRMGAALDDAAVIEDEDLLGGADGGEPVRHHLVRVRVRVRPRARARVRVRVG